MQYARAFPLALALISCAACSRASDSPDRAHPEAAGGQASGGDAGDAQPELAQRDERDDEAARRRWESRPAALFAAELQAYSMMIPVLVAHCARCHQPGEPEASDEALEALSIDGFPLGGAHAHELDQRIRAALGLDGSDPTMPKDGPGALTDEELELVSAWADAFARAKPTGIGHHGDSAP